MVSNLFSFNLLVRLCLLTIVIVGLTLALTTSGFYAVTLLLVVVAVSLLINLFHLVNKTNLELVQFLQTVKNNDMTQVFKPAYVDANFDSLSTVLNEMMEEFRQSRQQQEDRLHHLNSLLEQIPVPLISLFDDDQIKLHNNAARRLFGRVSTHKLEDLEVFNTEFPAILKSLEPGKRVLVDFADEGQVRQLTVSTTSLVTPGDQGATQEKLVSLQDIQRELDFAQQTAWQELVKVLTHEIMNSITPVASLAKTASQLIEEIQPKESKQLSREQLNEQLVDISSAIETVARRSDGLMQFVQNYRSLTHLTKPIKQRIFLDDLFGRIRLLQGEELKANGIILEISVDPAELQVSADPSLLEQQVLNLVKNAKQAFLETEVETQMEGQPQSGRGHGSKLEEQGSKRLGKKDLRIALNAHLSRTGKLLIEVEDNGPGIPADIEKNIFVPFFTTKPAGSGVGLALTRQIMIAHGGSVSVGKSSTGGAKFSLYFE